MAFPQTRMRRLRATHELRGLVRETQLSASDLVYPLFVAEGLDGREPIWTMPGIDRLSMAEAVAEAGSAAELGIPAVILFGIPACKDARAPAPTTTRESCSWLRARSSGRTRSWW